MPEEPTTAGPLRESQELLAGRLDRLEREVLRENRWWRGGLIAALVLLALSLLIAGHHRHHRRPNRPEGPAAMAPMGPPGWAGPPGMPCGQFGPYAPPPPWGCPCGCEGRGRFNPRHFREWGGPAGPEGLAPEAPPSAPKG